MTVPASVPSLFHTSRPCTASLATKYSMPFKFTNRLTASFGTSSNALTRTVPAGVPSVFHSSLPPAASPVTKNKVLPMGVRSTAPNARNPGAELLKVPTSVVPARVPSVFHSVGPLVK